MLNTVKVKITGRSTNSVHFAGEMKIDNLPQLAPILSLYEGVSIEEAGKMLEKVRKELTEKPVVSLMSPFNRTTIQVEKEYPARVTHFSVSIEENGKDKTVVLSYTLVKGFLISREENLSFDEIAFRKKDGEVVAVMEKERFLESLKEATAEVVKEVAGHTVARRLAKEAWRYVKANFRG